MLAALGQREAEASEGGGTCAVGAGARDAARRQAAGVALRALAAGLLAALILCGLEQLRR